MNSPRWCSTTVSGLAGSIAYILNAGTTKGTKEHEGKSRGFPSCSSVSFVVKPFSKSRAQERQQVPTVDVLVRCLTRRVVPAGQHRNFVVEAVPSELIYHLPREFRQEGQIVRRINNQRLLRPAGKLPEVRHRTDSQPGLPQFLQIDLLLDPLPDMAR